MIYLVLAIVLLVIILFVPIRLVFEYKNKKASVKLYFCKIRIFKKHNKNKNEVKEKPEEEAIKLEQKSKSLGDKIKKYTSLSKSLCKALKRSVRFERINLSVTVGTGDAALTAVSTGALWASAYTLLGIIGRITFVDEHSINISPDYNNAVFNAEGKCIIKSRLVYIIFIVITILRLKEE